MVQGQYSQCLFQIFCSNSTTLQLKLGKLKISSAMMRIQCLLLGLVASTLYKVVFISGDYHPTPAWESLTFSIASFGSRPLHIRPSFNYRCREKSFYYCLQGYLADDSANYIDNNFDDDDLRQRLAHEFEIMIASRYSRYSFYGVVSSVSSCCNSQRFHYLFYGYRILGLSPSQYFEKLTNYSDETKPMNAIQYYYDPGLCVNVITSVGFGPGALRRNSLNSVNPWNFNAPLMFVLPLVPRAIFSYENPRDTLTFAWFKNFIICRANPWLCDYHREEIEVDNPPSPSSELDIELERRRFSRFAVNH